MKYFCDRIKVIGKSLAFLLFAAIAGCATGAKFVLPPNSTIEIEDSPVVVKDGYVETTAFFWGALGLPPTGGARYRLVQDENIVTEGRLRTTFRPQSLLWPPLIGLLLYPVGLDGTVTYDLVHGTQVKASP